MEGKFEFTFEPLEEKLVQENITNAFSLLKLDQSKVSKDISWTVQGKRFDFNTNLLAVISPMFREMFKNCTEISKEIPNDDSISSQTVETFKNILEQCSKKPVEITLHLYEFADKYHIQPLIKVCGDYFLNKIDTENVLEISRIANMVGDDSLLKKAAAFLKVNPEVARDNPQFFQNNLGLAGRIYIFQTTMI